MSEETKEQAPVVVVSRNNIDKQFVNHTIVRGPKKGKAYPAPQVNADTFPEDVKWIGIENILGLVNTGLKRAAQLAWIEATNKETGDFNIAKFIAEMAEFSFNSQKLSELQDRLDELQAEQGNLVDAIPDIPAPEDEAGVLAFKAHREKMVKLSAAIRTVKEQIENKKRKPADEQNAETEPAVVA